VISLSSVWLTSMSHSLWPSRKATIARQKIDATKEKKLAVECTYCYRIRLCNLERQAWTSQERFSWPKQIFRPPTTTTTTTTFGDCQSYILPMCRNVMASSTMILRAVLLTLVVMATQAFTVPLKANDVRSLSTTTRTSSTSISISTTTRLYGWADAFKNDETLGKPQNAGLKNGPNYNTQVTVNNMAVKDAVVGQKLTVVASRVRVKIPVNCQKGDCGTCMVSLNGRKVKACQTTLPSGKASIKTL
jgi:ferredoxin